MSSAEQSDVAERNSQPTSGAIKKGTLRLFEIASVQVRLDHVAGFIVNANDGMT
jgi:hypothetical protein